MPLECSTDACPETSAVGILPKFNVNVSGHAWPIPRSLANYGCNDITFNESRSLAYYRTRVSKNISNYFDEDFWDSLVLQVGEKEPTVRYAILALSALYEASENSQPLDLPSSTDRHKHLLQFAIYQHNNAISKLLESINAGRLHLEMVLMSCLIFTWIEFLRENVVDALRHLHSGLRLLREHEQLVGSHAVINQVAHILGRVLIKATLNRSSTIEFDYNHITGYNQSSRPLNFVTLREARHNLDGKISSAIRFLRQIGSVGSAGSRHTCCAVPDSPCFMCMYRVYVRDFGQWEQAFCSLRDRLDISTWTTNALQALDQLELSYLLISNQVETVFATTPMAFDKYTHVYARVLYLCGRILHRQILGRATQTSIFTFPFDNSVEGALLNVVLRCRHLPIRREAVRLLQLCPDREGIWQPAALVVLCNWKINTEEKGRPQGAFETDPLPENARVYVEGAREFVRDGQRVVAIRFQRGAWDGTGELGPHEEEVPNVSLGLARLLGMRMALLLRPASNAKARESTTKSVAVAWKTS